MGAGERTQGGSAALAQTKREREREKSTMTTAPTLRTKQQLFEEMSRLVHSDNFNLAKRDQFDRVKLLFGIANSSDATGPTYNRWHQRTDPAGIVELQRRCHEELRRYPAALEFFSRSAHSDQPVVSDHGTKLTKQAYVVNGRPVGKVVQMRRRQATEGQRHRCADYRAQATFKLTLCRAVHLRAAATRAWRLRRWARLFKSKDGEQT